MHDNIYIIITNTESNNTLTGRSLRYDDETAMCSDDTATVCYTLPPKYSKWLVVLSHYMLVNVVVAYRLRLRLFCGLAAGGYLTSVNYWRRPMHDWRRAVDILWINTGMAYHLLRAALLCTGFTLHQKVLYDLSQKKVIIHIDHSIDTRSLERDRLYEQTTANVIYTNIHLTR